MSNPTSNYGWQMPTATDLVTDLPADFEVFGQAVDTALMDLKGGTTGQILSKATNTDMDFTWITNDVGDITAVTAGTGISGGGTTGAVTITNSMATAITTAGDLIKGTGSGTFDRLGIGTTGQVLTVAAGAPSWATPSSSIGTASSTVATLETTTSTSYTNLTTTQSVTLTTGTKVLVLISCGLQTDTVSKQAFVSYTISGATTQAASDAQALIFERPGSGGGQQNRFGIHSFATVTAGSNTFTLKFKAQTPAEGQFENRTITVINLGS